MPTKGYILLSKDCFLQCFSYSSSTTHTVQVYHFNPTLYPSYSFLVTVGRRLTVPASTSSGAQPVLLPLCRYNRFCIYSAPSANLPLTRTLPTIAPTISNPLAPTPLVFFSTLQTCLQSLKEKPAGSDLPRRIRKAPRMAVPGSDFPIPPAMIPIRRMEARRTTESSLVACLNASLRLLSVMQMGSCE